MFKKSFQTYLPTETYAQLLELRLDVLTGMKTRHDAFSKAEFDFVCTRAALAGFLGCVAPTQHATIREMADEVLIGLCIRTDMESPESIAFYATKCAETMLRYGPDGADAIIDYAMACRELTECPGWYSRQELEEYADRLPAVMNSMLASLDIQRKGESLLHRMMMKLDQMPKE